VYRLNELVYIDDENDEKVLVDLENGKMYQLSEEAFELLTSINKTNSIEMYVEKMQIKYSEVDKKIIRKDAEEYINELIDKNILELKTNC
jgi:D-tyrosyl-tRNA(Tyr) deacylase